MNKKVTAILITLGIGITVLSSASVNTYAAVYENFHPQTWVSGIRQEMKNEMALNEHALATMASAAKTSQAENASENLENDVEESSDPAGAVQTSAAQTSIQQTALQSYSYSLGNVCYSWLYSLSSVLMSQLRAGSRTLYYSGSEDAASLALGEICYAYCGIDGVMYSAGSDANGPFLLLDEGTYSYLMGCIAQADAEFSSYRSYVGYACSQVQTQASQADLVNAINAWICSSFGYVFLDQENMYDFINTGMGKCTHYSQLMVDMCNAFGISAWKVHNDSHCWVQISLNGTTYTFDPTYNDTTGSLTGYSWM